MAQDNDRCLTHRDTFVLREMCDAVCSLPFLFEPLFAFFHCSFALFGPLLLFLGFDTSILFCSSGLLTLPFDPPYRSPRFLLLPSLFFDLPIKFFLFGCCFASRSPSRQSLAVLHICQGN
jgi:hypothetical protein